MFQPPSSLQQSNVTHKKVLLCVQIVLAVWGIFKEFFRGFFFLSLREVLSLLSVFNPLFCHYNCMYKDLAFSKIKN